MAFSTLITLTLSGADTGPFNLYSNIDGYTVAFESSVTKLDLEGGYLSTLVPDSTTTIRVKSTSVLCTNYVDLVISGITTTTTTTTTTTSTTTTTTTTIAPHALEFFWDESADVVTVTDITVNTVSPTAVFGSDVPFSSGAHFFSTTETGVSKDLEITTTGEATTTSILVVDSASNVYCQDYVGAGVYLFENIAILNSTPATVTFINGACA